MLWLYACVPHPAAVTPAPSRVETIAGPDALAPDWQRGVVPHVALEADDPSLGPVDARFTLVSYTDFFCPHCAHFWPKLVALSERSPDLRVVAKSWPIDRQCNPVVQGDRHTFACLAALAAECAHRQGGFLAMAELLYTQPEHVTPPEISWYADQAQLDRDRFTTCLSDPSAAAAVVADVQSGNDLQIPGTPSVFLGGVYPDAWVSVTPDITVIEQVLSDARRGTLR